MSAKQINSLTVVQKNVLQWRKTHPVHKTATEIQATLRKCDQYHVRHGRIVSIAQALSNARRA